MAMSDAGRSDRAAPGRVVPEPAGAATDARDAADEPVPAPPAGPRRSGIDFTGADAAVRPQDDLFGHVNGGWWARTQVPADRGRFGTFDVLRDRAQEHVRDLLQEAAADGAGDEPGDGGLEAARALVGAFYAAYMDEARVEELGLEPLREVLADVDACADVESFWRLSGRLARESVLPALVPYVDTDRRSSQTYIVYLTQAGLGLPDEAYYREEQYAQVRESYLAHVARLLGLAGTPEPQQAARAVMALETRLAGGHWDRVSTRDAVKTYTKVTRAELGELGSQIPWDAWAEGLNAPAAALQTCVVGQPSYVRELSAAVAEVPLAQWRLWLRWQVLRAYAPYLADAFVQESFDFNGRTLTGAPELRSRWRRGIALVDQLIGQAAGRLYVERHFTPVAKGRMGVLVGHLVEAYRHDISRLDWMSPQTRRRALDKLDAFTPKIGYPDTWRDYSGLVVDHGDLVGNLRRAHAFETDREWAKLGGPVDRDEWFMSPQTVNAYYNPGMNEIVFPAAILQPPFFDVDADDAVNYGAIGAVIGHEIGHGFDDQGSRYDGAGNLVDWWTEEDRARFDERATALIAQYDGLSSRDLPGEHVNGSLTVGENIGDLGGVTIAALAYAISLDGQEAPVIDGLTGAQRFFVGWAQAWRGKSRPEEAKRLLSIDPHSPIDLRANIVRNLTEFHEAYDVRPGDGLWLPEEDRVRIW